MNFRILWRMARWARNPPSTQRVVVMLAAAAASLVIAGLGHLFGLPAWLVPHRLPF